MAIAFQDQTVELLPPRTTMKHWKKPGVNVNVNVAVITQTNNLIQIGLLNFASQSNSVKF